MQEFEMTPEIKKSYHEYISHQRGLAFFKLWVEKWEKIGELRWSESLYCATLSPLSSRRFLIGSPRTSRGVRGRNVFLGIQKDEKKFFTRIPWKKVVFEENKNGENSILWFISNFGYSPDTFWPDLPAIAIGVVVDASYLSSWSANKIDLRGVWKDENNNLKIERQPIKSINATKGSLKEEWRESERKGIKTLKDIVQEQIDKTNIFHDPGFKGALAPLSKDQKDYLSPFKGENEDFIENRYPELFGQFLDSPPESQ